MKSITLPTLVFLALSLVSCNLVAPGAAATQAPATLPPVVPAVTETPAPVVEPSPTTSSAVSITSVTGSLNIRRGPGISYNPIGFLQIGQSAVASGRDTTGGWLYIPMPGNASISGWVASQTQYATVEGEINSLPVLAAPPPMPVTIRNCTYHPMLIQPGNFVLSPQNEAPNNLRQVNPGDYSATDQSVGSQVWAMSLVEGNTVDITTDGLSNMYACP